MVEYLCNICGKKFKQRTDYNRHLNRKNPCKSSKHNENIDTQKIHKNTQEIHNDTQKCKKWICNYCKKDFTTNSSYNRHMSKFCKIKKEQDNAKEDLLQKLIKEMAEMKEVIKQNNEEINKLKRESKKNIQNVNSIQNADKIQNNTQNNILSNTVNNIKIIAYGKEDLSHLLEKDYKLILNKGFKSVPALVESIHFNKNKPENHNIYISNMRDNYVLIYDGKDWQLRERENVLQEMVDNKTEILNEKFEELVERLDESTIRKFRRFLDQKDDDTTISNIKKDLKLLLYNKRKTVEDIKNLEQIK